MEPRPALPESQRLGRYVVLGTLGRGGAGTVLEAFDRSLDRRVAVKVLHRELGERHRQRLVKEAQALAKLSHPNVVQVYEVGLAEDQAFIAMELVRGRSLSEWLRQEPPPSWRDRVQMYLQAGEGLAAAHARGLVHRDFKPSNAVVDDKGRVRVLDFGLVQQAEDVADEHVSTDDEVGLADALASSTPLTETGPVRGTPGYMPLEQMRGRRVDARSDQFSFCVALYEALYGERPFEGDSLAALMLALQTGRIRKAPPATKIPQALRKVLLRGLSTEPGDRWPTMDALLVALRRQVAPRRKGVWALSISLGLLGAGIGIFRYAAVGFRCDGAAARLDGVWDEAREQEVREAILATGLSYAPDTWARVEPALGEYADAWSRKHTEVCEATSVRHEQPPEIMDLRMECLRERRVALREVVGVLARADATRVEKAVGLVSSLPALSRCDDVEALAAAMPPPEDPRVAGQVEALRERLSTVRSLRSAGAYDAASAEADASIEQAEALDYAPLLAEALVERSWVRDALARYPDSEADAERAYVLATGHGHDAVAADAAGLLVRVVGNQQARHELGLQWGTTALAVAKRRSFEPELEAMVRKHIGGVLVLQGEHAEALEHHQRALAILEEVRGPQHPQVASAIDAIGHTLGLQGKFEESLAHHQRALAIMERSLGPDHPSLTSSLKSIGNVLSAQRKLDASLPYYQRALTIEERTLGARHPDIAASLYSIGNVLSAQGKNEEALTHFRRSLAIAEEVLGPRHPNVAMPLYSIGVALMGQDELDEALVHLERALAIREEALGPRHPQVANSLNSVGVVLMAQERFTEALAYHRRALAIHEEVLGPRHFSLAAPLANIGVELQALGKPEESQAHFERALAITEAAFGPRHPFLVETLISWAEADLARGDYAAARAHAERGVSICESSEAPPDMLAGIRFMLARALWHEPSERPRARALAEQAREALGSRSDAPRDRLAKIEQWLAQHHVP